MAQQENKTSVRPCSVGIYQIQIWYFDKEKIWNRKVTNTKSKLSRCSQTIHYIDSTTCNDANE